MKYCPKCDKNKENSEFNTKRVSVDGLHNKCKSCMKIQNKNHYINNRDKKKYNMFNFIKNKII
jgi:hypothetical protein